MLIEPNYSHAMSKYRNNLPQLNGKYFITDGGMETTLIYHFGMNLPHFASFDLLTDPQGKSILREYYEAYLNIAVRHNMGFILESPTWRASRNWGYLMGYSSESLAKINKDAIVMLEEIRGEYDTREIPVVISGCVGPKGDGYAVGKTMNIIEATKYHEEQISILSQTSADMITSFTLNYIQEALGMTFAAIKYNMPIVLGFTVETNGKLPSGESLQEAIETIDKETGEYPTYYMINCAHPSHFEEELKNGDAWKSRIMAIRANASKKSHAELDESEHLDSGDACELAHDYQKLRNLLPYLKVIGGCCGTDHTHIEEICNFWR